MNGTPFLDCMGCAVDMHDRLGATPINKQRAFNSIMHCHAVMQTLPQRVVAYNAYAAQLGNRHPLLFVEIPFVAPHIILLLLRRFPAAIFWRIIPIVVDASKAMFFRWTWTHIGKEIDEAVSPALTDSDTSATVASIAAIVFVMTTLFHHVPYNIFNTLFISHGCAVDNTPCASMASTTDCYSTLQTGTKDDFSYLAIAQAQVANLARSAVCCPGKHDKFTEPLAG